ncbi:hypothetical protein QUF64_08180 [Anaerolineales bacterium HSG6]|nr:hypothetical protein [Anaerolineales bacterium HSG6]MDM8531876.1 hypothetical protein [Anaerolineales bacterium HSG25]
MKHIFLSIITAIVYSFLLIIFIIGFSGPAFVAAWLLALLLPYKFSQILWLCLGTLITMAFVVHRSMSALDGEEYSIYKHKTVIIASYVLLMVTTLLAWLASFLPLDLSLFETTVLLTIGALTGLILIGQTVNPPDDNLDWLFRHNEFEEDDIEDEGGDEVIITPSTRRKRRRSKR